MIGFNLKATLLALLAFCSWSSLGVAGAPLAEHVSVHTISFKVLVDGIEVMTPNLDVASGRSAYVTMNSKEKGRYTLQIDVVDEGANSITAPGGVQVVLWKGGVDTGRKLLDGVLLLEPTPAIASSESRAKASLAVRSKNNGLASAEIQVVSHAASQIDVASLPAAKSCLNSDGIVPVQPLGRGCCTRECKNGREEMTCCGAVRCCACDVCCTPK